MLVSPTGTYRSASLTYRSFVFFVLSFFCGSILPVYGQSSGSENSGLTQTAVIVIAVCVTIGILLIMRLGYILRRIFTNADAQEDGEQEQIANRARSLRTRNRIAPAPMTEEEHATYFASLDHAIDRKGHTVLPIPVPIPEEHEDHNDSKNDDPQSSVSTQRMYQPSQDTKNNDKDTTTVLTIDTTDDGLLSSTTVPHPSLASGTDKDGVSLSPTNNPSSPSRRTIPRAWSGFINEEITNKLMNIMNTNNNQSPTGTTTTTANGEYSSVSPIRRKTSGRKTKETQSPVRSLATPPHVIYDPNEHDDPSRFLVSTEQKHKPERIAVPFPLQVQGSFFEDIPKESTSSIQPSGPLSSIITTSIKENNSNSTNNNPNDDYVITVQGNHGHLVYSTNDNRTSNISSSSSAIQATPSSSQALVPPIRGIENLHPSSSVQRDYAASHTMDDDASLPPTDTYRSTNDDNHKNNAPLTVDMLPSSSSVTSPLTVFNDFPLMRAQLHAQMEAEMTEKAQQEAKQRAERERMETEQRLKVQQEAEAMNHKLLIDLVEKKRNESRVEGNDEPIIMDNENIEEDTDGAVPVTAVTNDPAVNITYAAALAATMVTSSRPVSRLSNSTPYGNRPTSRGTNRASSALQGTSNTSVSLDTITVVSPPRPSTAIIDPSENNRTHARFISGAVYITRPRSSPPDMSPTASVASLHGSIVSEYPDRSKILALVSQHQSVVSDSSFMPHESLGGGTSTQALDTVIVEDTGDTKDYDTTTDGRNKEQYQIGQSESVRTDDDLVMVDPSTLPFMNYYTNDEDNVYDRTTVDHDEEHAGIMHANTTMGNTIHDILPMYEEQTNEPKSDTMDTVDEKMIEGMIGKVDDEETTYQNEAFENDDQPKILPATVENTLDQLPSSSTATITTTNPSTVPPLVSSSTDPVQFQHLLQHAQWQAQVALLSQLGIPFTIPSVPAPPMFIPTHVTNDIPSNETNVSTISIDPSTVPTDPNSIPVTHPSLIQSPSSILPPPMMFIPIPFPSTGGNTLIPIPPPPPIILSPVPLLPLLPASTVDSPTRTLFPSPDKSAINTTTIPNPSLVSPVVSPRRQSHIANAVAHDRLLRIQADATTFHESNEAYKQHYLRNSRSASGNSTVSPRRSNPGATYKNPSLNPNDANDGTMVRSIDPVPSPRPSTTLGLPSSPRRRVSHTNTSSPRRISNSPRAHSSSNHRPGTSPTKSFVRPPLNETMDDGTTNAIFFDPKENGTILPRRSSSPKKSRTKRSSPRPTPALHTADDILLSMTNSMEADIIDEQMLALRNSENDNGMLTLTMDNVHPDGTMLPQQMIGNSIVDGDDDEVLPNDGSISNRNPHPDWGFTETAHDSKNTGNNYNPSKSPRTTNGNSRSVSNGKTSSPRSAPPKRTSTTVKGSPYNFSPNPSGVPSTTTIMHRSGSVTGTGTTKLRKTSSTNTLFTVHNLSTGDGANPDTPNDTIPEDLPTSTTEKDDTLAEVPPEDASLSIIPRNTNLPTNGPTVTSSSAFTARRQKLSTTSSSTVATVRPHTAVHRSLLDYIQGRSLYAPGAEPNPRLEVEFVDVPVDKGGKEEDRNPVPVQTSAPVPLLSSEPEPDVSTLPTATFVNIDIVHPLLPSQSLTLTAEVPTITFDASLVSEPQHPPSDTLVLPSTVNPDDKEVHDHGPPPAPSTTYELNESMDIDHELIDILQEPLPNMDNPDTDNGNTIAQGLPPPPRVAQNQTSTLQGSVSSITTAMTGKHNPSVVRSSGGSHPSSSSRRRPTKTNATTNTNGSTVLPSSLNSSILLNSSIIHNYPMQAGIHELEEASVGAVPDWEVDRGLSRPLNSKDTYGRIGSLALERSRGGPEVVADMPSPYGIPIVPNKHDLSADVRAVLEGKKTAVGGSKARSDALALKARQRAQAKEEAMRIAREEYWKNTNANENSTNNNTNNHLTSSSVTTGPLASSMVSTASKTGGGLGTNARSVSATRSKMSSSIIRG